MAFACPNCSTEMTSTSSRGLWVHACRPCGGIWLDTVSADFVRNKTNEEISRIVAEADARATVGPQGRVRPCPVCRHPLGAFQHGALQLDGCRAHGVFFDRSELRVMLEASGVATASATSAPADVAPDSGPASTALGVVLGVAAFLLDD